MHTTEKCRMFLFRIIFQWTKELDESRLSLYNNIYTEHTKILCMLLLILVVQNDAARICMRRIDKKRISFDFFFSMAIVRVFFFVHSLLAYFSNVIPLTARILDESKYDEDVRHTLLSFCSTYSYRGSWIHSWCGCFSFHSKITFYL